MNDEVIEYKSAQKRVAGNTDILETIDRDGIVCTWNGRTSFQGDFSPRRREQCYTTTLSWNFDWSELRDRGVESITGYLIVIATPDGYDFAQHNIDIDLEETKKVVKKEFYCSSYAAYVTFEYRLTLHYAQKISYDEMFAASEMNDTVLVIEGKKVHVNKAFLSYHSEFFRDLFSSKGQMSEIPIEKVTYEDFGLLMSIIYPKQVFPTDNNAEKLLKLANRFLIAFVTRAVEHHLLEHSKLKNEKMLWMADAYGMQGLMERCICSIDTAAKIKALVKSEDYDKLSGETCKKLVDRIVQLI